MDSLGIVRQLWRHRLYVAIVVVIATVVAVLSAYRLTSNGLQERSLQVGAASSQILVDSPGSTLVAGATSGTFDALSTRARIYGQYLSSLEARQQISKLTGFPAATITTSGPFSADTGQASTQYQSQSSESRAGQLVDQGAQRRLVFTAQEGVPIITVDAQADNSAQAIKLADASFVTLKRYVRSLKQTPDYQKTLKSDAIGPITGVTVRELGTPEGGTIGGANDKILMALAFLTVLVLGCAMIVVLPRTLAHWRTLDELEQEAVPPALNGHGSSGNGHEADAPGGLPQRAATRSRSGNGGRPRQPEDSPHDKLSRRSAPSP